MVSRVSDEGDADCETALEGALKFVQPKLQALKTEKGLIGVFCQAWRMAWKARSALSLPAQKPAFYGVWSGKIHIGTWPDEKTAREVASEYDDPTVVPLYASPQPEA